MDKRSESQAGALTVLTLNTHKGFSAFNRRFVLHELREAVRSVGADVVFLQEVLGEHELLRARHVDWPAEPQYEFLADSIWESVAYGRNAVYPGGHHGNALLSKFPIKHYENHDVSVGTVEKRGLLYAVLGVPGRAHDIHAICVHLALREAHRREQVELLCKLVDKRVPDDAPLIVAGDFNDWRVRADRRLRRCARLQEAFLERRGRLARSFPSWGPFLKLDRVYYRNVQPGRTQVLSRQPWSRLSDHAALTAEFAV